MIVTSLYNYLSNTAGITALVSTRIYPVVLPQNATYPAITYQVISTPIIHTVEGCSAPNTNMQIDCWSTNTYLEAHQVADAVETALDNYSGTWNSADVVSACLLTGRQDLYEDNVSDYRVMLEFSIWHKPV